MIPSDRVGYVIFSILDFHSLLCAIFMSPCKQVIYGSRMPGRPSVLLSVGLQNSHNFMEFVRVGSVYLVLPQKIPTILWNFGGEVCSYVVLATLCNISTTIPERCSTTDNHMQERRVVRRKPRPKNPSSHREQQQQQQLVLLDIGRSCVLGPALSTKANNSFSCSDIKFLKSNRIHLLSWTIPQIIIVSSWLQWWLQTRIRS